MNRVATGREYERRMSMKNGTWPKQLGKKGSYARSIIRTVEEENGRVSILHATKGWRDYNPKWH